MNKQEEIDYLRAALEGAEATIGRFRLANAEREARNRDAARAREEADRLAAENATIRQIEDGLIPVAELRKAWRQTHTTPERTEIEFNFPAGSKDRIREAVLKALNGASKPKPKFAAGGFAADASGIFEQFGFRPLRSAV